jgi:hypothetical protein
MAKSEDRKAKTFVRNYLAATCGVTLLEVKPRKGKKSVDFEMMDGPDRVLVAELKTFEYYPPSTDAGWAINEDDDGSTGAYRVDHNAAGRVLEKISGAYKQVSAYPHPWAVILHNADMRLDISHIHEAFAGERVLGRVEDRRIVKPNPASYGRTLTTRYEIDLYIWVDELDRPCRLGVYWSTPMGETIGRKYFATGVTQGNFPARWPRPRTPSP